MQHADLVRVQSGGCLAQIRALLSSLYPALRRVGEYVLEYPGEVIALPIQELAERIGVSEATIVRFTQAVGYSGLRAFKLALVGERATPAVDIFHEEVRLGDDPLTVSRKVLRSDIQAIADTLALLETQQLEPALDALCRAQHIEVYGIGSSAPIAVDAYYRLLKIGLPVSVVTDAHMMAVSAASLTPRDVAFIVSHTGRTTETLNAAAKAAEAGATVISLSSHRQTPLDQYATIRLVTADRETAFRTEAMASRIAHLSLIDALCVNLAIRGLDSATAAMERSSTIIEERRVRLR